MPVECDRQLSKIEVLVRKERANNQERGGKRTQRRGGGMALASLESVVTEAATRWSKFGRRHQAARDIHVLRSALRRVEAALDATTGQFDPKAVRKLAKLVGRVRRQAGSVRDVDVTTKLARTSMRPRGEPKGRRLMLAMLKKRRNRAIGRLREMRKKVSPKKFNKRLESVLESERSRNGTDQQQFARWIAIAAGEVRRSAGEKPSSADAIHRLRLDIKRLRYIAELTMPALGARAKAISRGAARLADRLGEMNDLHLFAAALLDGEKEAGKKKKARIEIEEIRRRVASRLARPGVATAAAATRAAEALASTALRTAGKARKPSAR